MRALSFRHTRLACYLGYITQATIVNLPPLLFVSFQHQFGISLPQLALLISVNFGVQLLVDLLSLLFVDKIGYRTAAVVAHLFCTVGLVSMGLLPFALPNAYWGLMIATVLNAIGGGIIEVIISPIIEATPSDSKAGSMSILHSFYCWGVVAVVLLCTLFFNIAGTANWRYLPMAWAALPLTTAMLFAGVPINSLIEKGKEAMPVRKLLTKKTFALLFLMMLCAGAAEQAMSQWASLFAETGLKVSKTMGDLLGPCLFAVLMGLARLFFGLRQGKLKLESALMISSALCIGSYLLVSFSPVPLLSLIGCALCGLSVGLMWPGTLSLASRHFPLGGTAMFAILALAGDVGCASGPGLVGAAMSATTLARGILPAIAFPILLALCIPPLMRRARKAARAS